MITFNEDELTSKGTGHVESLHITGECKGMIISTVPIHNGYALNVCFAINLSRIGVDNSIIRANGMLLWAFNGSKASKCRETDVNILIGPCQRENQSINTFWLSRFTGY